MEGAIWGTVGSLFVLTLSGLGYLSVKHPATFGAITRPLAYAFGGLGLLMLGFSSGVGTAAGVLSPLLTPRGLVEGTDRLLAFLWPCVWAALGFFVFTVAMLILSKVSRHISENQRGQDNKNQKPE